METCCVSLLRHFETGCGFYFQNNETFMTMIEVSTDISVYPLIPWLRKK